MRRRFLSDIWWNLENARDKRAQKRFLKDSAAEVATTQEYTDWVEKNLKRGGQITSVSSGAMGNNVYIARQDAALPALFGATALSVIVPEGVTITAAETVGHNNIFLGNGALKRDSAPSSSLYLYAAAVLNFSEPKDRVIIYKDTAEELKRRGHSLKDICDNHKGTEWNKPPKL